MENIEFNDSSLLIKSTIQTSFKTLVQTGLIISRTPMEEEFQTYAGTMAIFNTLFVSRKKSLLRQLLNMEWGQWKKLSLDNSLFIVKKGDVIETPISLGYITVTPDEAIFNQVGLWTKEQIRELIKYHMLITSSLTADVNIK